MEHYISALVRDVKNDSFDSLNMLVLLFTTISLLRLSSDVLNNVFCRKETKIVASSDKLVLLEQEVANLQTAIDRMDNYVSQIHFQLCVNPQSADAKSLSEVGSQDQEQDQTQQEQQEQVQADQPQDKHSQLRATLKNGDQVSLTYKKQTFAATFTVKAESQHGYVLKSGTAMYNTPSHFSHAMKVSINDKIRSDNGWDSVYVMRDGNKLSLNDLLAAASAAT